MKLVVKILVYNHYWLSLNQIITVLDKNFQFANIMLQK